VAPVGKLALSVGFSEPLRLVANSFSGRPDDRISPSDDSQSDRNARDPSELVGVRGPARMLPLMDETMKTAEVLSAWREATRAAELTERIAAVASKIADEANEDGLARLAEQAAEAADRASTSAWRAAQQAADLATSSRPHRLSIADAAA
jgi:hypothetical protein